MDEQSGQFGVVPRDVLLAQDGLGFLKAIVEGKLPSPPITETLGFELIDVEHGRALFAGVPTFRHYNPIGVVHAGFAATLLDSALGCAVHSTLARGEGYTTLELKLNLVRAITKDTGRVTAEGRLLHRGRTVGTAEGYLRDAEGRLYAHATTTCMIFPAKDA
ncbi:MAG: PaaI family thioesterase [Variibacter sp.]|nr:PaaI family thioesterase [Variibacter sp.]